MDYTKLYTKDWMVKTQDEINEKRTKDVDLIPAEDARYIADTTSVVLKRICRHIRQQAADEGATQLQWCVEHMSESLRDFIVNKLTELGYSVTVEYDNILTIDW